MQTILVVLLCSAFLNFLPSIDSRFLLFKIKASKHGSQLSGRMSVEENLQMESLGYTMSKSKKCNENDIIHEVADEQSLNDARKTCDANLKCVFIYRPDCSVGLHNRTGEGYLCQGLPVNETMVESNGTSCIWEKKKSCQPQEVYKHEKCNCGSAESCLGNIRGEICDSKNSKCMCSKGVEACKDGEQCMDGVCSANGQWESWVEVGECTPSCGVGKQERTRKCTGVKGNGNGCQGEGTDKITCTKDPVCDDIYTHAHTSTLCKNSKPINGRKGCKTDLDCLANAKKSCDEDHECVGIAWNERPDKEEQALKLCHSRESETNDGWRTMWRKDVRQDCTWKDWAPWSSCKSGCEFNPYNEDRSLDCSKYCRKKTSRGKNPEKYGGKPCAGNAHKDTSCGFWERCNAYSYCKWLGTSPACGYYANSECPGYPGEWTKTDHSKKGDGAYCSWNWKIKCCQTRWHGPDD